MLPVALFQFLQYKFLGMLGRYLYFKPETYWHNNLFPYLNPVLMWHIFKTQDYWLKSNAVLISNVWILFGYCNRWEITEGDCPATNVVICKAPPGGGGSTYSLRTNAYKNNTAPPPPDLRLHVYTDKKCFQKGCVASPVTSIWANSAQQSTRTCTKTQ